MASTVNYDHRRTSADRMLSMPIDVHAAGWRSDTLTLQRNGWEFFVEYSMQYMSYRLMLTNRKINTQAITFEMRLDNYHLYSMNHPQIPPIVISEMDSPLNLEQISHGQVGQVRGRQQGYERVMGHRYHAVDMDPCSLDTLMKDDHCAAVTRDHAERVHIPVELILFRPAGTHSKAVPDMVIKEQDTEELLSLLKDKFVDSDEEYYDAKGAGLITDPNEIKRHLHLVTM